MAAFLNDFAALSVICSFQDVNSQRNTNMEDWHGTKQNPYSSDSFVDYGGGRRLLDGRRIYEIICYDL